MNRSGAASRLMFGAMVAAIPLVVVAKLAAAPPPEPLAGLESRDIRGISASPDRVWRATLQTFRAAGFTIPPGIRWEYLPWDTPIGRNGETIDGVADVNRTLVRVNPFKAVGDARDLPGVFAHEVAHLVSYQVDLRPRDDEGEEASAEAQAHDLVPTIRHRLRITAPSDDAYSYQQQLQPFMRGTFRACRHAMPRAKAARVERCARHTRRAFLLMDQANRAHALQVWGIQLPAIPPRDHVHAWIADHPARTVAQQLVFERQRWATERARYRRTIRALTYRPDAHVAFQLAGLAYGQDWRHLRACALSEGYREAERYDRHNARPNRGGSGATGPFQFMAGTFASTPQGRAGLDWHRVDVQAHAAAWMWANGRRGEWTGKGC